MTCAVASRAGYWTPYIWECWPYDIWSPVGHTLTTSLWLHQPQGRGAWGAVTRKTKGHRSDSNPGPLRRGQGPCTRDTCSTNRAIVHPRSFCSLLIVIIVAGICQERQSTLTVPYINHYPWHDTASKHHGASGLTHPRTLGENSAYRRSKFPPEVSPETSENVNTDGWKTYTMNNALNRDIIQKACYHE